MRSSILNKILLDWRESVKSGVPDTTDATHLSKLFEILGQHGWPGEARMEFIGNIVEQKKKTIDPETPVKYTIKDKDGKDIQKTTTYGQAIKRHTDSSAFKAADALRQKGTGEEPEKPRKGLKPSDFERDFDKEKPKKVKKPKSKPKVDKTPQEQELSNEQTKTSDLRDKGVAGAGGETASQGESRYCGAVDNLDYDKFNKENAEDIKKEKDGLDSRKPNYPSTKEVRDLAAIGLTPDSDEGKQYIASREVWANQELKRMQDMDKPNVFTSSSGFGGSEKGYKEWMRAAYDGALATQEHLKESRMDTSQPHQTIQSTTEIDNKVEADLEKKLKEAKTPDDKKYYERELKSFKKFRTYHDTYVVGRDENGRTFIVSVSNKKGSDMSDPQANTTPSARFEVMKKDFGTETAQTVTTAIDDGIKKVTTVTEETKKSSTKVEVDDDFVNVAEVAAPKRVKQIGERGNKRKRSKEGKPRAGSELGCYLEDNGILDDDWNKMSTKEKIKKTQEFMGDDKWHGKNGTKVSYDPYGKLFIKVGEVDTGGHRSLNKVRAELEKRGQSSSLESKSVKDSGQIKKTEQNSVKDAHQGVVNKVTEADKEQGYPKDGKNGPHTQAYVNTVIDAMHYNTYIDMEDDEDDKVLVQMGINGAKASHIRGCLADKSGYKIPPGNRDGLKNHLKETCSIEAETGAIVINSKDKDGDKTHIADDTWRTAGTSQKVASGFGSDMKDCVKSKVAADRSGV